MSHTFVVGNLTKDPEIRRTQNGKAMLRNTIAENRKDANGDDRTTYVDIVIFGDMAENVAKSLKKGTRVMASGRLGTYAQDVKYERDGELRDGKFTKTELLVNEIGPALRWATATVEKVASNRSGVAVTSAADDGGEEEF